MRKVGFVVDSTFKITTDQVKKLGIEVVPLKVIIDEVEYVDGEFDFDLVVKGLHDKKMIRTSQPSPDQFLQAINNQFAKGYDDVVVLTLSKTLSGTLNSAVLAKTMVENNEHIHVIDTQTTISGGSFITLEAVKFADQGHEITAVLENIHTNIKRSSLIFTVDNLSVLVKNGRLSRVSGLIGNVMRVKPILRFEQGELVVEHKARGTHRVIEYIINEITKVASTKTVTVIIEYVDVEDRAKEVYQIIKDTMPNVTVEFKGIISPVVAAHVGLGGLGFYIYSF